MRLLALRLYIYIYSKGNASSKTGGCKNEFHRAEIAVPPKVPTRKDQIWLNVLI